MFRSAGPHILRNAALFLGLWPCPAGAQWRLDGAPVCTAPSNQFTPVGVADGAGGAIVAWFDYRSGSPDIYAQHVLPSGAVDPAWPADGRALCTASGGQYSPVIVADGTGGAIAIWHDDRGSNTDVYAQHVLASGALDPAWPANGRGLCTASGDQIYPAVTSDGAGGAIATWRDDRGGPDTDIYSQRVLASGAVAPGWPSNGRAICTASGNQSVPSIAPDVSGGAFIAWSDLRGGVHSDIYVQRVLASGTADPAWPTDGRALCTAIGNQSGPTIVADGSGGAIVTWFDYRSGVDADIYAQHVLGTGAVDSGWPAGGRALCTAADEQYSPVLVADGAGGAIAIWYDYRNGPEADIYAQRVLSSGALGSTWPANGRALCTAAGEQTTPGAVSDGADGAIAAWFDYRPAPNSDIYAQHVPATGATNPGWPADGEGVCAAAGDQYSPSLVADGAGGAIISWTDFRGGLYSDIYAQLVHAGGTVAVVEPKPEAAFALHSIRPNPARAQATVQIELSEPRQVTVEVLDPTGRRVRTLLSSRELPAGPHVLVWDGADDAGMPRASGVYWVRVIAPGRSFARKLVLLR